MNFWPLKKKESLPYTDIGATLNQLGQHMLDMFDRQVHPDTPANPKDYDYRITETTGKDENGEVSKEYALAQYRKERGLSTWKHIGYYNSLEDAVEARKKHNKTYERKVVDYYTHE